MSHPVGLGELVDCAIHLDNNQRERRQEHFQQEAVPFRIVQCETFSPGTNATAGRCAHAGIVLRPVPVIRVVVVGPDLHTPGAIGRLRG